MKHLRSFNENVIIPVLDVLIDDNGNLYNGDTSTDPNDPTPSIRKRLKGNISLIKAPSPTSGGKVNTINGIIGQDGIKYPAGIDKNGTLVSVKSDRGFALNSRGDRMRVPQDIITKYGLPSVYWKISNNNINIDYSDLVPMLPTGWVNIKVDMEVLKRVRRYSKSLGTNNRGFNSFTSKLEDLARMSGSGLARRQRSRETIQKEMSVIILLHYINEIKDFFTSGSSGFLFESFLAGMIPNGKVVDDNSSVDVSANGENYQIKLYNNVSSQIPVTIDKKMSHYVICIKNPGSIDVYLISNTKGELNYYNDYIMGTPVPTTTVGVKKGNFSYAKIVKGGNDKKIPKYTFDLLNIEEKIETIATGLKSSLDGLYSELSQFQYNVETIITGVDEKGDVIDDNDFTTHSNNAQTNITKMEHALKTLIGTIRRD